MPDDVRYNTTHASMGLMPPGMGPIGIRTPTPAETAFQLNKAAQERASYSDMMLYQAQALANATSVGVQFRQQMGQIQQQQSMNPYVAQALASSMPGASTYDQGMMPSPLTMTPASTGVFRPQAQSPNIAPLPPIYMPRHQWMPTTPKLPEPMFRTPHDQQQMVQDASANRAFSYASQLPQAVGTGAGIAGGAYLGARMGRRFGGVGAVAGAVGGAALAGLSGVARGVGEMFQTPMQPLIETRQMGAALQTTSQDWVVSGSQLHGMGRGLSRDASISLAGSVKDLAGESSFKEQTQSLFNKTDLMKIIQKGGVEGLFDMAQTVPQIKNQLRETAITIKQFMELTNDPDVSNIVREMGRLRQFGLTQQEMVTAAQGLRTYARAAGTSIEGVQSIGGLPGAATFQQAGLSAGTGFQYGNYAAAASRQMVASGAISPRQLALMGGVQGMTQRDIQAQAAFSSMPLFAASNAQYGSSGWGVNQRGLGQSQGGAFGMVQNALSAMNQGVRRGGIGALATFPLQQRELADKAASEMTPEQLMAQRFQMAQETGVRLGLKGESAFAAGAQTLYGTDVAEQMLYQAKDPRFFKALRKNVEMRQRELSQSQAKDIEDNAPILGGVPGKLVRATGLDTGMRTVSRKARSVFEDIESIGTGVGRTIDAVTDPFEDRSRLKDDHMYRTRLGSSTGHALSGAREAALSNKTPYESSLTSGDMLGVKADYSNLAMLRGANQEYGGAYGTVADVMDTLTAVSGFGAIGSVLGLDPEVGTTTAWLGAEISLGSEEKRSLAMQSVTASSAHMQDIRRSVQRGGKRKYEKRTLEHIRKATKADKSGTNYVVLKSAARKLDQLIVGKGSHGKQVTDAEYRDVLANALQEVSGVTIDEAKSQADTIMSDPSAREDTVAQMTYQARENSVDKSVHQDREKQSSIGVHESIDIATKARTEKLQEDFQGVEEKLGIEQTGAVEGAAIGAVLGSIVPVAGTWIGAQIGAAIGGAFGGFSSEEEDVQRAAGKFGGKKTALIAAMAQANKGDTTRLKEVQEEYGFTDDEMEEADTYLKGEGKGLADRFAEMSEKGDVKSLTALGVSKRKEAAVVAFGGKGFVDEMGKYSKEAVSFIADPESDLSAQGIAQQFSKEQLIRMSREGGAKGRQMAKLIGAAKTGDAKATGAFERYAVGMSEVSEEGVEDKSVVTAKGKEGQKLEDSKEALSALESMSQNFAPAVKDFNVGTKLFREVMETQRLRQMNDE